MWRGQTWVNINYLLIEGLARSGYTQLASELRSRTLDLIARSRRRLRNTHPDSGIKAHTQGGVDFRLVCRVFIDLANPGQPVARYEEVCMRVALLHYRSASGLAGWKACWPTTPG